MILGPEYGTPEWEKFRCGKVTASRFGDVLTPPKTIPDAVVDRYAHLVAEPRYRRLKTGPRAGEEVQVDGYSAKVMAAMAANGIYHWSETAMSYMYEVLASAITGKPNVGGRSAAMDRGVDMEQDAITAYERLMMLPEGSIGVGRIIQRDNTIVCDTPDGFNNDDDEGPGSLEVKCPESKTHLKNWLEWRMRERSKIPHVPPDDYLEQVQGHLWITERRWCDFVSFDDRFPPPMQMVRFRVYRDEPFIQSMSAMVLAFAKHCEEQIAEIRAYLAEFPEHTEQVVNTLLENSQLG